MSLNLLNLKREAAKECKGSIYKADVQHCTTTKGFGLFIRLNKMKKMSCPGCKYCGWEDDNLNEISKDWPVHDIEKVKAGKLYKLETCNETKDFETGYPDGWDLKLVKYKPEEETEEKNK